MARKRAHNHVVRQTGSVDWSTELKRRARPSAAEAWSLETGRPSQEAPVRAPRSTAAEKDPAAVMLNRLQTQILGAFNRHDGKRVLELFEKLEVWKSRLRPETHWVARPKILE